VAEGAERESKTEAPSQRRLDEARREGDVVRSPDVSAFATLAAAAAVAILGGGAIAHGLAARLLPFIAHPDLFDLSGRGGPLLLGQVVQAAAPAGVVLLAAAAAGAAGSLIQHGLLWVPKKLAPDASKLNPIKGLERLFGVDGLVAFAKSLAKLMMIAATTWWVLKPRASALQGLVALDPAALLPFAAELLRALLLAVLVVLGVTAGLDWLWQRQRYMQRLRMSREELKQDAKETDGDPHIKARLKQLRAARAKSRMMQAVPKATVVIANPTHYAVALRYVQGETAAPLCVAKGVDSLALRIREVAEGAAVPVVEDPPLARALYAAMNVDEAIPREHYEAVAKVIGFILNAARPRARPNQLVIPAGAAQQRRAGTATS